MAVTAVDLLAARLQMAVSLAFHIVFAEIGIALPLAMVLAEARYRRSGDVVFLELAKSWAKGAAVLFAVGAVSGTVLSFELGLLWPRFMQFSGSTIGLPFALEGFAFFAEAIFLGIYLYGWNRVSPRMHLFAGIVVAVSGAASAVFVVMVNAWMNAPDGTDALAAMRSPAAAAEATHMLLAAYASTGLAVAGIHAAILLRRKARLPADRARFHRHALVTALLVGAPAALLQPLAGDWSARVVARTQPLKLAALEGQFRTERGAPLRIGGWPDASTGETRFAIEIPRGLSWLAYHDADAEVRGLESVAPSDRPPVLIPHLSFQLMILFGTASAFVAALALWTLVRKRDIATRPRLLRALAIVAPFGFIATEAGWMVTEVGRQPWTVQGLLRTADAVTPMPGLMVSLVLFTLLYLGLAAIVVAVIASMVRASVPRSAS